MPTESYSNFVLKKCLLFLEKYVILIWLYKTWYFDAAQYGDYIKSYRDVIRFKKLSNTSIIYKNIIFTSGYDILFNLFSL